MWKAFTKRGVEVSLPKTGNHAELFAICGMTDSATKDQVSQYISKMMVQFLVEYEDSNGKRPFGPFFDPILGQFWNFRLNSN